RRHTHAAADAAFRLQHGTAAIVQREGFLTDGAGPGADAAFGALERDAALRIELQDAHVDGVPGDLGQRTRRARSGARHVFAGDAGARGRIDVGRGGRQAAARVVPAVDDQGHLESHCPCEVVDAVPGYETHARVIQRRLRVTA